MTQTKRNLFKVSLCMFPIALTGCGKSVNIGTRNSDVFSPTLPPSVSLNKACPADQIRKWIFTQPPTSTQQSVDLLFVLDTSSSLNTRRAQLASSIPAFIGQLDPRTDYRIGTLLAHGGASPYSGMLYQAPGSSQVLNSQTQSAAEIQQQLANTLSKVQADKDEANGEMMMYSLMRSLEPGMFEKNKTAGFFRDDAVLSVVFVSDENDVCYPAQLNGFTQYPDFKTSVLNWEAIAYDRYCKKAGSQAESWPSAVYSKLIELKGENQVSLAGIIHHNPAQVPTKTEAAIGHGILQLVQQAPQPVFMDITSPDFSAGLAKLGNVVKTQLNLLTLFQLEDGKALDINTIEVKVDGIPVKSMFSPESSTVQINQEDAGRASSLIEIAGCVPQNSI
jgi:hypothetical protein